MQFKQHLQTHIESKNPRITQNKKNPKINIHQTQKRHVQKKPRCNAASSL